MRQSLITLIVDKLSVSLACDTPTVPPLHPYQIQYYQNISKGIKVIECTRMHLQTNSQTDGRTPCRSLYAPPEPINRGIKSDLS